METAIRRGCGKSLSWGGPAEHFGCTLCFAAEWPSAPAKPRDERASSWHQERFGSQEQEPVCQQSSWCCAPPAYRRAKGHPIPPQPQSVGSHQGWGSRTSSSPAQPRAAQAITTRPKQLCLSKAALSSSPICCSLAQKQ